MKPRHCRAIRACAGLLWLLAVALRAAETAPPPAGGWRLAGEASPYLQLHADNPVTWYPWGAAALQRAQRENKPLFISIGYYTCHWCHVMARESFSDPAIAALLNAHFVAIKIDREQRPDLDAAYMEYVLLTAGQGGWPLSVWATPQGEPFFGGTYFPPHAARGRSGFREVLEKISSAWQADEAGVRKVARHAVATLRAQATPAAPRAQLTAAPLQAAREAYAANYDALQGGFGPAPKFPEPARLLFLLADRDAASAPMALATLDHMLSGGIHDRLAGGWHRYATDFEWRIPHFEKMLYDQALLARACLAAWERTGAERYRACVTGTLDFTLDALRAAGGGFHAALAADSAAAPGGPAEEGAAYTWTWAQLDAALPEPELKAWAVARYGLEERGNATADPTGELAGRNVLWQALDDAALTARFGVPPDTVPQRNAAVDERLRSARRRRPPVPVDDKVVTAWNGYQITALAEAGRKLNAPRYRAAARAAARFLLDKLYDADHGVLYRDWRGGVRGAPGFLEDYAALAQGLLALHDADAGHDWLRWARQLADGMCARFEDTARGGFFRTPADTALWLRDKPLDDGAALSGNAMAVQVLLTLERLTGQAAYGDRARRAAAWAAAQLASAPDAMPGMLSVWPQLLALSAAPDRGAAAGALDGRDAARDTAGQAPDP
ncbi:MAG: thioredoxin domain-containing protein [Pseudomonadota bacterium]